jgi:hypothetical protein
MLAYHLEKYVVSSHKTHLLRMLITVSEKNNEKLMNKQLIIIIDSNIDSLVFKRLL